MTRWGWVLVGGTVATIAYLIVPTAAHYPLFGATGVACLAVFASSGRLFGGTHRNELSWRLTLAALTLWSIGDLATTHVADASSTDASLIDAIYPVGYLLLAVALLRTQGPTRLLGFDEIIESTIVAVAAGLVTWAFVLSNHAGDASEAGTALRLFYVSADVFLLCLLAHLTWTRGFNSPILRTISAAIGVIAIADIVSFFIASEEPLVYAMRLFAYVLFATASAFTPAANSYVPHPPRSGYIDWRLVGFTIATLLTPIVMATEIARGTPLGRWGWVIVGISVVSILLVSARVASFLLVQQRQATRLSRQARIDAGTRLWNRQHLLSRFRHLLATIRVGTVSVSVIAIDGFDQINETFGYSVGDVLLRDLGRRMRDFTDSHSLAGHLGGYQFAIIQHHRDAHSLRLDEIAGAIAMAANQTVVINDVGVHVESRVGMTACPVDDPALVPEAETLLQRAHVAAAAARLRQPRYAVYEPSMDGDRALQMRLMGEFENALATGQLRVHYQPRVDLHLNRVTGVEALVRWQHPRDGLIAPGVFLPIIEQTGLLPQLTAFVIDSALERSAQWRSEGMDLDVGINLAARNLVDANLPEAVRKAIRRHRVPPDRIEFEVTESSALTDTERALNTLLTLRGIGASLSIDDYGTGYSSLDYLRTLPVQRVKIDRSLVGTMTRARADAAIVGSTVELARLLGVKAVAEGVEDSATLQALRIVGCDEAQGFYLAKPVSAEDLPGVVRALNDWIPGTAITDDAQA
ncbi:putative bifunctional diguanylate cyclase/phosphodiesterase [Williamsia sterculiae]|nr:bifunctional diguanylate cyclase/phosphodiesterase [Williamsia sterculiae]